MINQATESGPLERLLAALLLSLLAWGASPSQAQTVSLLADINSEADLRTSPDIEDYIAVGDTVYIAMFGVDRFAGSDLYAYDRTTQSLRLLKDISPNFGSAQIREMVHIDGVLYFYAFIDNAGGELYRYVIDTNTFEIVADLRTGNFTSSSPTRIRAHGGQVYFQASVDVGYRFFRYDPASDLITNLSEPGGLLVNNYTFVGDDLYVLLDNIVDGSRIHRFNQDTQSFEAVVLTAEGFDPHQFSWPDSFTGIDGYLFYAADGPNGIGREPFVVDLQAQTVAYVDIRTDGSTIGSYAHGSGYDGHFYFSGYAPDSYNNHLYKMNAADRSFTNIAMSPDTDGFGGIQTIDRIGSALYVRALHPTFGYEPFRVDLSTMEVTFIGDTRKNGGGSPERWRAIGDEVWFITDSDVHGKELFRVTDDGYALVEEFSQQAGYGDPRDIGLLNNKLYLNGNERLQQREVFSIDLSTRAVQALTDFSNESYNGLVLNTVVNGAGVAFRARGEGEQLELYFYSEADGLRIIDRGELPQPDNLYQFGDRALVRFFIDNVAHMYQITDTGELVALADLAPNLNVGAPQNFVRQVTFQGVTYGVLTQPGSSQSVLIGWDENDQITRYDAASFGFDTGGNIRPLYASDDLLWLSHFSGSMTIFAIDANGQTVHSYPHSRSVSELLQVGDQVVVLEDYQTGYRVIDLVGQSSRLISLPEGTAQQGYGEELRLLEGRIVATASSQATGSGELVEIDLESDTVTFIAELEAGPRSSSLRPLMVVGDKLYVTGRSVAYGDEIYVFRFNSEPVISGSPSLTVQQGQAFSFTPTASDPDPSSQLLFSINNKPSWASFDTATGTLSGTPGNSDVGVYSGIEISVSDGQYSAALPAFTVTVENVNDAPTISGTPATSVAQDAAYSFTPQADDVDVGAQLVFSVSGLPRWASFDTQTGALTGTPRNADVGVYAGIVISVSDGELSASLPAFTITVTNVNDAPVITGTPPTTAMTRVEYSFTPQASDIDADAELTFFAENLPEWLMLNSFTGTLSGTPNNEQAGEYVNIVLGVSDGELSDSLPAFTITVLVSNRAPVANNDSFNFEQNAQGSYVLPVLANDSDPDQDDSLEIIGARISSGPGTLSNDGQALTLSLAPSYTGTVTVAYTIADNDGEQAQAVATVTISADSTINLVVPADLTMDATGVNTVVRLPQSAQATDGLGRPLAVSLVDFQSSYTSGTHQILWRASNGVQTITKAQQLMIRPRVSLERNKVVSPGVDYQVGLSLSGPAPAYPYAVTVLVSGDPVVVSFTSGSTAQLAQAGLANDGDSLQYQIAATSNPGDGASMTVTAELDNVAPEVTNVRLPQPLVQPDAGNVTVSFVVTDANQGDTYSLTFAVQNSVSNAFITVPYTLSNGSISFDPSSLGSGKYRAQVTATDAGGLSGVAAAPFTIRSGAGPRNRDEYSVMAVERDSSLSCELDQNDNGFVDCIDGRLDDNGNGVPNYLDTSFVVSQLAAGMGTASSSSGSQLVTYPREPDARSLRVAQLPQVVTGAAMIQAGLDVSSYRFIGDFYDFRVQQLAAPGGVATVVLPLDAPLAANAEWLIWQAGEWRSLMLAGAEAWWSAGTVAGVCPAPGAAAWQAGLVAGSWCLQLQLLDGGVNDVDGAADGAFEMFGGLAVADAGNGLPIVANDTATVIWQGSAIIDALANDSDPDGDSLTILSARAQVGTVSLLQQGTRVQYQALANFAGTDQIDYVVSDGQGGIAVAQIQVTVIANRAPIATADSAVTVAGRAVTVNVLANDSDPDGDSITLLGAGTVSPAAAGSVTHTGSSISFMPAAGFTGLATVQYQIGDNRGGEALGTLSVQVNAAPEVIEVRPASGSFWWWLSVGGLLLVWRRR